MFARVFLALLVTVSLTATAGADTTIVDEDFESYTTNAQLLVAWPSQSGSDNGTVITTDPNFYPGIDGQAAEFCGTLDLATCDPTGAGTVNLWGGNPLSVAPSPTQNVELSFDLGDDALSANKRLTIGLRNSANTENIIEMGLYNGPVGFAYRAQLFFVGAESNPNWVSFDDTVNIDNPLADALNSQAEAGAGFHTFKAVISVDQIVFSLDLYADGVINDPNNPVPGVGLPGVDASDTVFVVTTSNGFDDLRFGIPSSLPSSGGDNPLAAFAAFDNILLQLVDIGGPTDDADFNDDNLVDGLDFLAWQRNSGLIGGALNADGDANGDGNVDGTDLGIWETQYGGPPPLAASVAAVPEPASGALLLIACGCWGAFARRR